MKIEVIDTQYIKIRCVKAIQPIGPMYIGVIDSEDLRTITFADVRELKDGESNELDDYMGIQRKLDIRRAKDIGKYLKLVDATFPNSIILSISSEYAIFNESTNILTLPLKDNIAKVLDGQHRIAGFDYYDGPQGSFQVIVTIYIDMELEDQAIVFATINKEQKPVSPSLVADLFAFAESRSPQKTAHNIARALNKNENSPFFDKIKILGTAESKNETITQATFVEWVLKYITTNKQSDRDFYKRHKNKSNEKLELVTGKDAEKLFLRNLFIEDLSDIKIAQNLWNYFHAVQKKWPIEWNVAAKNNILNKSTGFIALMRFFKHAYLSFNKKDSVITKEEFWSIFESINIDGSTFNTQVYIPGGGGQKDLYKDLLNEARLN